MSDEIEDLKQRVKELERVVMILIAGIEGQREFPTLRPPNVSPEEVRTIADWYGKQMDDGL